MEKVTYSGVEESRDIRTKCEPGLDRGNDEQDFFIYFFNCWLNRADSVFLRFQVQRKAIAFPVQYTSVFVQMRRFLLESNRSWEFAVTVLKTLVSIVSMLLYKLLKKNLLTTF